jgi:hypothetical protein
MRKNTANQNAIPAIDPDALKTLIDYDLLKPDLTPRKDFEHAKAVGLMFEPVHVTHEEAIEAAFRAFSTCDLSSVASAYLVGLGQNLPYLRAALPAYAVMHTYIRHDFVQNQSNCCGDCAMLKTSKYDLSFINGSRFRIGGFVSPYPPVLALYLDQHSKLPRLVPSSNDVMQFVNVLRVIAESDDKETPTLLAKRIRKVPGLKLNVEQARYFLETLGYAGILDTPIHPGAIFKHSTHLVPRKSSRSDWAYPIDFWTGADGINEKGLAFWFSDYPEIINWRDS